MAKGIASLARFKSDVFHIEPSELKVKEGWNCREYDFNEEDEADMELARSIAEVGVREPLTVVYEGDNVYVTNGHRRRAATMYAIENLKAEVYTVPVRIDDGDVDELDRIIGQLIRNSGKALKPLEQAAVITKLMKMGMSKADIAKKIGKSATQVSNILELAKAPVEVKDMVRGNEVSASVATKAVKDHGGEAAEVLQDAKELAASEGKKKPTQKHVDQVVQDSLELKDTPPVAPVTASVDIKQQLTEMLVDYTRADDRHPSDMIEEIKDDLLPELNNIIDGGAIMGDDVAVVGRIVAMLFSATIASSDATPEYIVGSLFEEISS